MCTFGSVGQWNFQGVGLLGAAAKMQAFADVPCCPNAGANATAVANAVKAGCQSVIAKGE